MVTALITAGADPNADAGGRWPETPLHWAASSDDVEVLDALLDGGADIEAPGASIAGGTPLDDAVGYGQWRAARRLVERGARVNKLWHAAALGMMSRVEEHFAGAAKPAPEAVSDAFWQACHGGQRAAAEYLLARGGGPELDPFVDETNASGYRPMFRRRDLLEWPARTRCEIDRRQGHVATETSRPDVLGAASSDSGTHHPSVSSLTAPEIDPPVSPVLKSTLSANE